MNNSSYINPLTQRNNYYINQNLTLNPSSPRNNNIFPIKEDIEWLFLCERVIRTIRNSAYYKSNSSCFTLVLVVTV